MAKRDASTGAGEGGPSIRVQRKRRRLYEPIAEPETPAESVAEAPARKTAPGAAPVPKKTPARKAPAKKAPARKPPAKKAPARKAVAKKVGAATPSTGQAPAPAVDAGELAVVERAQKARALVAKYARWSAALGLVPLPFLDSAVGSAMTLKMLHELTGLYDLDYSEQRAKVYLAALLGFFASAAPYRTVGRLFLTMNPLAAVALEGGVLWGVTTAIGKVFIQHFELGGTLLDFEPEKMRQYLQEQQAPAA